MTYEVPKGSKPEVVSKNKVYLKESRERKNSVVDGLRVETFFYVVVVFLTSYSITIFDI